MVWISSSQDCDFRVPFSGVKQSGIDRELGEAGLEVYTRIKAVHLDMVIRLWIFFVSIATQRGKEMIWLIDLPFSRVRGERHADMVQSMKKGA